MSAVIPENKIDVPYTAISNNTMATAQLQRAWCLMLVKALWPTVHPTQALGIAQWLMNGSGSS